ncbi:DDHD domain-containing protein [Rozella allomycis CSF55]|uniref:DDHD domain-containing protein n=1 Tax=Rozella allomycis (strain CSF55) TaxID=988480 RepID=A0A075AXM0_ROZAC|nr:DDHD domain-containing protein [Rozella allomycis CSF55]|eukprot:EPZ34894.1 DDHD domain-containing protein [Rozella allomycis CSF55]
MYWWFYSLETSPATDANAKIDSFKTYKISTIQKWLPFPYIDHVQLEREYSRKQSGNNYSSTLNVLEHELYEANIEDMTLKPIYWSGKTFTIRRSKWFYESENFIVPCDEVLERILEEKYLEFEAFVTADDENEEDCDIKPENESVRRASKKGFQVQEFKLGQPFEYMTGHFITGKHNKAWIHDTTIASQITKAIVHYVSKSHAVELPSYKFLRGINRFRMSAMQYNQQITLLNNEKEKYSVIIEMARVGESLALEKDCRFTPNHLVFVIHGIGQKMLEKKDRDIVVNTDQMRSIINRIHPDNKVMLLPVRWRTQLEMYSDGDNEKFDNLYKDITLQSIPMIREIMSDILLDILLYMSPSHSSLILETSVGELNRIYKLFKTNFPDFSGKVSFFGHSLGSIIAFDILCHQDIPPMSPKFANLRINSSEIPDWMPKPAIPVQNNPNFNLDFEVDNFFAVGSPIGVFVLLRGLKIIGGKNENTLKLYNTLLKSNSHEKLVTIACKRLFNISDFYDPISYRVEPLICRSFNEEPCAIESIKNETSNLAKGVNYLFKIKRNLTSSNSNLQSSNSRPQSPDENNDPHSIVQNLNNTGRVDYYLRNDSLLVNQYLNSINAHMSYWRNEDLLNFIIQNIYYT